MADPGAMDVYARVLPANCSCRTTLPSNIELTKLGYRYWYFARCNKTSLTVRLAPLSPFDPLANVVPSREMMETCTKIDEEAAAADQNFGVLVA